jgi:hypothetical protein
LERGALAAKLIQPVYHGEQVSVRGTVTQVEPVEMQLELFNAAGALCAVGRAGLPPELPTLDPNNYPAQPLPLPEQRLAATINTVPAGTVLGSLDFVLDLAGEGAAFLDKVVEAAPFYRGANVEDALCHPAYLPAQANEILLRNVALGPLDSYSNRGAALCLGAARRTACIAWARGRSLRKARPRIGRARFGVVWHTGQTYSKAQTYGDHQAEREPLKMARKFLIKSDKPKTSLINYREALNDEQRAVVLAGKGPLLVIAGAGSGKTRTVTYRVARLIEAGVAPARIMLVTFTNRAAREMLSRVEDLLGADVRRVWGGTFHSLANRLLRRHAVSLGYENNFSILDSEDAKDLIDACIEEAAIDTRRAASRKAKCCKTSSVLRPTPTRRSNRSSTQDATVRAARRRRSFAWIACIKRASSTAMRWITTIC